MQSPCQKRAYRKNRDLLIDSLEADFRRLQGRLIVLYGYLYADRVDESRAMRRARIRAAYKKVDQGVEALRAHTHDLEVFMNR